MDFIWFLFYNDNGNMSSRTLMGCAVKVRDPMRRKFFALALLMCALMLALAGCGEDSKTTEEAAAPVDDLAIRVAELTAEPAFIDWRQDGVDMQLLALKNGDGEVQLAYNTCQSCAGSPYAYFEYENDVLTCQNCGNRFGPDSVGRVAGGCNPKPVSDYSVEGDAVVIPTSELASVAPAFKTWKAF